MMTLGRTPQESICVKWLFIGVLYWALLVAIAACVHFLFTNEISSPDAFDFMLIILAAVMAGRGAVNEAYAKGQNLSQVASA